MTAGTDWWDQARRLAESFRAAPPSGSAHGSDCRWCPLCQAAAVLRGERPEVTAALADILASTAAALREFAGEESGEAPAGDGEAEGGHAEGGRPDPAPAVQRIDVG